MQTSAPENFKAQMLFWHARHGPAMPPEIVNEVLKQKFNAYDFTKDQVGAYPPRLFVRVKKEYLDVDTRAAYAFQAIRGKLMKTW